MGNAPSGAEIDHGLRSNDPQRVLQSLRLIVKATEGRGKDGVEWASVVNCLAQLMDVRNLHTKELLSSPELFNCLSSLTRLPRPLIMEAPVQQVLTRNLVPSLLTALGSNLGAQVTGSLLGGLTLMLGDQRDATLEDMAAEDTDVTSRGYGAVLAKKLGRRLNERKYSAQHCGLFPGPWKRLLLQVALLEKHLASGQPSANGDVHAHPLTQLLQEIKNFERYSIVFAVFLFHHYLQSCRPGDLLLNLLVELGDFLETNIARISTALGALAAAADDVVWCGDQRIVLRRPDWLNGIGDLLYDLIAVNRRATVEEQRAVASAAFGCFQVYAQVYRHTERVLQLVEFAIGPFEALVDLLDLPNHAQDLEVSLQCLHTHILHARLSDVQLIRTLDVLCLVLYRLCPFLLDTQQPVPPFLASPAQVCLRCVQALVDQPAVTGDPCSRQLLLRLLALSHARLRPEVQPAIFDCLAAIAGVWDPAESSLIVPFVLESCLQLLSFAALFWAEMRAARDSPATRSALHALATDLLLVPRAAPPATQQLLHQPDALLMRTGVEAPGCTALLGLLDTCSTQPTAGCVAPVPTDALATPADFRPPPPDADLLRRMDFVYFSWGSLGSECSIVHLCTVDDASRCSLVLPSSVVANHESHQAVLAALSAHLHEAVHLLVHKTQRLLHLLHTETPIAALAMSRLVQFFAPLHASHLMCFVEASILLGGTWGLSAPVQPPAGPAPLPPILAPQPASSGPAPEPAPQPSTVTRAGQQQLVQQLREEVQHLSAENHRLVAGQEAVSRLQALSEAVTCSICFENFLQREPCALQCGHIFCYQCVAPLLSGVCPLCRTPLAHTPVIKLKSFNID